MNWKKYVGAALALGALIVGAPSVLKLSQRTQTTASLEQKISHTITETEFSSQFKPITKADEITLNNLEMHLKQYHSELDKILERRQIQERESSKMIWQQVLNPLISHIDKQNPEMLNYLLNRSGGKTDFSGDDFLKYMEQYFEEKGYSVVPQCRISEYGTAHSMMAAKILKTTVVSGTLWGNQFNLKVLYLDEPRIQDYTATRRLKYEKQVICAENLNETIYVNANSNKFIFDMIKQKLTGFNIQEPTTREELFKLLISKGIKDNRNLLEKKQRLDLIHEAMHTIYHKTHNYPFDEVYARNMDELSSFLTELKNESTEFIYFKLGNILSSDTIELVGASKVMFNYFLTEMEKNRHEYENIDYKKYDGTKKAEDLLMQVPKLTVSQIRNLAEKCFNNYFPELNKAYNPADKQD